MRQLHYNDSSGQEAFPEREDHETFYKILSGSRLTWHDNFVDDVLNIKNRILKTFVLGLHNSELSISYRLADQEEGFSGATPALSHRPFISRQIFDRSNDLPVRVVNTTRRSFFVFAHSSEKADAVCPAGTPYAVCLCC